MGSAIASLTGKTSAPVTPGTPKGAIGALISTSKTPTVTSPKLVDPNTLGDTKALNAALQNKQITQQQFADQYNKVVNKSVYTKPKSLLEAVKQYGPSSALSAGNKVFVQPVKEAVVDTAKQSVKLGKQILAPAATGQQRQSITTNQSSAYKNPEYLKATASLRVKGLKPGDNSAEGLLEAQKMAAKGAKAFEIRDFLLQDAAKLNTQTQKGVNALSVIGGINVGDSAAVRAVGKLKQIFKTGPEELLRNTTAQRLAAAGEKANTPVKIPVKGEEVSPTGVLVRTPVHAGIKDVSTTTKIGVRTPNQMSEEAFTKEFNNLSKGYERDTKSLSALPPARAKALTNSLETHYQTKLNDLLDRYHKPDLTAPVKPKTLATSITKAKNYGVNIPAPRARSAFDRLAKQSAEAQKPVEALQSTSSVKPVESTTQVPKAVQKAPEKPTTQTTPAGTEKVSGSSLRTQQEAVQAGMKSEAQTTGATFKTVSHKEEAAKAVKLVNENPQKAMDIAMGRSRGDSASHESAVYHAVKNAEIEKAKKTGDWGTVTELANSQRHTGVSEAAQKLGAEGYNVNPHDPVSIMNDVSKARTQALGKSARTVSQEAKVIAGDVKRSLPKVSREDWHSFVDSLKC